MKGTIKVMLEKYKSVFDFIGITCIIVIYFIARLGLIIYQDMDTVNVFNLFVIDGSITGGILTEIQLMLVVCATILYGKKGYIVGMSLCFISISTHLAPLLVGGQIISIIGMIIMIGGAILSTIVHIYAKYVNEQKTKLDKMANLDSLTGLVNRRTIFKELNKLCDSSAKEPFFVVFIDIDDFKKVNDVAGHYQGDLLIQKVVEEWKSLIHEKDLLGRIGGDEFALIIRRKLTNEEVREYINALQLALMEKVYLGGANQLITASFGVSKYPVDSDKAQQLFKYADTAMYMAKSSGKNDVQFFSKEMYEGMMHNMKLENALTKAIANNEMYLMYQPQYECHNKKLRGFEVLLRWKSEEFGFVSPADFIPLAEKNGQIIQIGEWVLETACMQFKKLLEVHNTKKVLSINISVLQLLEPNFVEMVKNMLHKTGFEPQYLEFEITETVFISAKDYIINVLNEIKAMGIDIALDDFGTSYASLSYIQMLPLDVLKIDKSFIDHIVDENSKKNLVGAIIAIAQELNYKVVAEGIEKQEQIQYLNEKGCDYVQGYLWGKPLIEADVNTLLEVLTK